MKPAVNRLHHHTVIPLALDTAGQLVHPMAQLQAFLIELLHTHMSIIKTQGVTTKAEGFGHLSKQPTVLIPTNTMSAVRATAQSTVSFRLGITPT